MNWITSKLLDGATTRSYPGLWRLSELYADGRCRLCTAAGAAESRDMSVTVIAETADRATALLIRRVLPLRRNICRMSDYGLETGMALRNEK